MSVDDETNELLRSRGLKCICQLCDCGRFHKHLGCTIQFPTVAATFNEEKLPKMQSDYKDRFPVYDSKPAQPIRHRDELRKTHPRQPMDLNTTNQMDYHKFDNPEVPKPCKLKGEIDKLMGGEFHDKTNYNDAFVGYAIKPTKSARPSTVFKTGEGKLFNIQTEYMGGFQKKQKIPQEKFAEKPGNTFDILHPDYAKLPNDSVKNSIHDGRQCERVKPCDMKKPNIDFGLHGEFDHTTTNGVHFQDYDAPVRRKYKRVSDQKMEKCKFEAISQNQADFKYDEKEAMIARGKRLTEPPSLIQLSMDVPHDFKTVSNLSYHNWKPENFKRPIAERPVSTFVPPNDKFVHYSHTHHDYKNYGVTPRTEMYQPPQFRKSSAKVSGQSMYSEAFQDYGKPERKFYGEYHRSNLHLPSPDRKFVASSTMRSDYLPMKIEKRESFKPTHKAQATDERFSTATEYNETFLPQENKSCKFSKYMAVKEASKLSSAVAVR